MDAKEYMKTVDQSDMYKYVLKRAVYGTAVGGAVGASLVYGGLKFSEGFRRGTNVPIRFFLMVAGAAAGFTIASDKALIHYMRYMDRPEVSGHYKISAYSPKSANAVTHASDASSNGDINSNTTNHIHSDLVKEARSSYVTELKQVAWNQRYKLIFAGWAGTMGAVAYRDFQNKALSTVHKFGHARIAAQFVTIAAVIAAFAFNEETGPFAQKYQPGYDRDAPHGEVKSAPPQ
ncbi:hypothetical protein MIR68_008301 [Amoeboaphelidium protococcarum]|nr:hypothetical protein MIR68_008301 [Amoeboaphelidium protococcarum]